VQLILFRGRPGTGKTTLSSILSQQLKVPLLRKDDIYDVASTYVNDHSTRNKIAFDSLYQILLSNVKSAVCFILDYPFQSTTDLAIIKTWCTDHKVSLRSILVTCSDETRWAQRFNERAKCPQPNQLITDFEVLRKRYDTMQLIPEDGELLVDTIEEIPVLLKRIIEFIDRQ
jgi:tRNA uridine 5-carbamoylmethylation protein Kti12